MREVSRANGTGRTTESRRAKRGRKGRDKKGIGEYGEAYKILPFLAGQVHASILAMPAGECSVQSRGVKSRHSAARHLRKQALALASPPIPL